MITFLFLEVVIPVFSDQQKEIEEYQNQLFQISQQINLLKSKIEEESQRESTLLSQLQNIGLKKGLLQKEIAYFDVKLKKSKLELSRIKEEIKKIRLDLAEKKELLKNVLVTLYKLGKFSYLQVILSAKNVSSLISGSKYISILIQLQSKTINDYKLALEKLNLAEQELKKKNEEIISLKKKAENKRKELIQQERQKRILIANIQKDKDSYLKTLEELTKQADQLKELVRELTKQKEVFPFLFSPIYEKRGVLNWPIVGRIITFFGLQQHPIFKTVTLNNGIEVSPNKPQALIRAIYYGKVVYADYFKGYGNLIIIDHGLKYYSLYGYCADFLINKGDFVKEGQPIAVVGDIGSLKGECLYFELRYKTQPLNPLQWLRKR